VALDKADIRIFFLLKWSRLYYFIIAIFKPTSTKPKAEN